MIAASARLDEEIRGARMQTGNFKLDDETEVLFCILLQ